MNYSILVNKDNTVFRDFKVDNLISVGKKYSKKEAKYTDQDILLESTAAKYLNKMLNVVNQLDKNVIVIPDSGYRSYEYQERVMNFYIEKEGLEKARARVAEPGTSEHHTGLAIDLAIIDHGIYNDELTGEEDAMIYLYRHAHEYGYILRFPKNKESITGYNYEPWHFRYVGLELAKELYEKNMTLEEYYNN